MLLYTIVYRVFKLKYLRKVFAVMDSTYSFQLDRIMSYNHVNVRFVPWYRSRYLEFSGEQNSTFVLTDKAEHGNAGIRVELLTEKSWTNFNGGTNLSEMELFPAKSCRPSLSAFRSTHMYTSPTGQSSSPSRRVWRSPASREKRTTWINVRFA